MMIIENTSVDDVKSDGQENLKQKRPRKLRNPYERLLQSAAQLSNIVDLIFDSAESPDLKEALLDARKIRDDRKTKSEEKNVIVKSYDGDLGEIIKLLEQYPQLAKQILAHTKSKISEYKNLGVLKDFK